MACTCNESYTCNEHQQAIDQANQLQYQQEQLEWIAASLKLIAVKLDIELPKEPERRY